MVTAFEMVKAVEMVEGVETMEAVEMVEVVKMVEATVGDGKLAPFNGFRRVEREREATR